MRHLVPALAQRLRAFQGKGTTTSNHHPVDVAEPTKNFLVVGNGAQRRDTCQVQARTGEVAGACAIGEQQFMIVDAPAVLQLHEMLDGMNTVHAPRHETNALILIKRCRAGPELFL